MEEQSNEKNPLCPICSETLSTNLCLYSLGYLYDGKLVENLIQSPISRQKYSYCIPVAELNGMMVFFEKKQTNKFLVKVYDLKGFDQDVFNKDSLDFFWV